VDQSDLFENGADCNLRIVFDKCCFLVHTITFGGLLRLVVMALLLYYLVSSIMHIENYIMMKAVMMVEVVW
jgi:hypothetical protein